MSLKHVLIAIALAAAALLAAALPGPSHATTRDAGPETASYADPRGDVTSAPDILSVALRSDAASALLSFELEFADQDALSSGAVAFVAIDADRDRRTGDLTGADYVIRVTSAHGSFLKWEGAEWAPFSHLPWTLELKAGSVLLTLCSCDLGTQTFRFYAAAAHGADLDLAPPSGWFSFPGARAAPRAILGVLVSQRPFVPQAGQRFTVGVMGVRLEGSKELVETESYSCRARLSGERGPLVGGGLGNCSWKLPRTSRGKPLSIDLTVSFQGVSATFSHTFKLR